MRFLALLAAPLLAGLVSCTSGAGPEGGATPPTPTTPPATPSGVAGKWTSASCGARAYERRLTFDASGTFSAEDRVSPCPPGTTCVWSGIVIRHGKYAVSGSSIQLTIDGPNAGPGQPLPASFALDPSGAPAELLDGGKRCVYARSP